MIKNLPRQLNEAGKIKIGKKGAMVVSAKGTEFRPPKKLDHFQLVTTEKNEDGDYIVDVALQNKIKEDGSGIIDGNGCLVGLPIRLLYNDTELNFPNRYVSYMSGKLSCHGDGEVSKKRLDNFEKDHPCPCGRLDPGYDGKDKCKPTGTLTCIIDGARLFGQAHKFRTTSMNTIKGILGGIELIKTATNGKIAGLPLMLTMNAKQTTTPSGISTTIYIVSICYRGSMSDLRTEVLQLMSTEKQYLLSMDDIEDQAKAKEAVTVTDVEEEREFVEEFFPDAVVLPEKNIKTVSEQVEEVEKTEPEADSMDVSEKKWMREPDCIVDPPIFKSEKSSGNPRIVEPVDNYKKIYDSLIAEKDFDKALAFAKRLQVGNLYYWFENVYPDIELEEKMQKTKLLWYVKETLKSTLGDGEEGVVEEGTETVDYKEDKVIDGSDKKPVQVDCDWDDSGPITKPQLRELVQLKTLLEAAGILRPDKWVDHVKNFIDAKGEQILKATMLTTKQGETFINVLKANVPKDKIPF